MTGSSTLGIYVQVPFCQTKCTYCNFPTSPVARKTFGPYVDAIVREIELWRNGWKQSRPNASPLAFLSSSDEHAAGEVPEEILSPAAWLNLPVNTVYVGGGTPSLLEPPALTRILNALQTNFCCELEEVTLEADPETVTGDNAAAWLRAGFNRVSLGAQSFVDSELRAAGRLHRSEDIPRAFTALRHAGFTNISADLIAGLPHQTRVSWTHSLEALLALEPEHISVYLMEIDAGSRLGREALSGGSRYGASALPDDDAMAEFYELACQRLPAAGYEQYEISNWARPDRRSRHNLKYWQRQPYLGLGAGAHSFNGQARWANTHDPAKYMQLIESGLCSVEQVEKLSARQALDEELFLGFRLMEGINVAALEERYNVCLGERLDALAAQGWLSLEGDRARLMPERLAVSNEFFLELIQ